MAWGKKNHTRYKVIRILGQLVHLPTTQDYTLMSIFWLNFFQVSRVPVENLNLQTLTLLDFFFFFYPNL